MTTRQQKQRERFAADTGFDAHTVEAIIAAANQAHRQGEGECNGDPHPRAKDPADKNECARLWGDDRDATGETLDTLAGMRFAVEFNGLHPSLKDIDTGRYIEIPK